ncbi:HNH endonuclease [Marinobacter adhaerens]|uniref:HNH endonuclease n=1 Tax=Marinobacter adhaerens TaxID=1033846 RepID=UPI003BAD005F
MWLHNVDQFASYHSITTKQASYFQCTGEHLIAHCEGGTPSQRNIVAACRFCNLKRHARQTPPDPFSYFRIVQRRLAKGAWNSHLLG